jgi:uncharacterized protein DUF3618
MSTSEQLEREAEQTRAEIASMLEELRSRMTPGQIVDQILDFARDSTGGQFFNNLRRQVTDNPVPVALVGAGIAWFMLSGRNGKRKALAPEQRDISDAYYGTEESGDYYGTTGLYGAGVDERPVGKGIAKRAQKAAGTVAEHAREAGSRVSETASSITSSVTNAASSASSSVAEAASSVAGAAGAALEASASGARRAAELIGSSGSVLRHNSVAASRSMANFLQEQPLVLAGAGLAIGAALGAMFPATRVENELMGEASDAIKRRAKEVAEEQIEKGKELAGRALDEAKQEADKLGFTSSRGEPSTEDSRRAGENMYRRAPEEQFSDGQGEESDQPQRLASIGSLEGSSEPPRRDGF